MAVRIQEVPVAQDIEYKDGVASQARLDRTSLIRRYNTVYNIRIRTGSTSFNASNVKHGGLLNLIKKVYLNDGADSLKFTMSGKDKYYQDLYELGEFPKMDPLTNIPANSYKDFKIYFMHDFAGARRSMSDFSQLLNAPGNATNDLFVEWGNAGDLYASGSAPSGIEIDPDHTKVSISALRAFEDGIGNEQIGDVLAGLIDPKIGVDQFVLDREATSYNDSMIRIPINPVRTLITSQMVFALENTTDGNPTFSNDVINRFKVENVIGGGEIIASNLWRHIWAGNQHDLRLREHPEGMIYMDWVDQRQGGLINNKAEDLEIRLLTPAPAAGKENAIRILYRYLPGAPV